MIYATIWSKSVNSEIWVIERTHSLDYIKNLLGSKLFETTMINNRHYQYCPEGLNPNFSIDQNLAQQNEK